MPRSLTAAQYKHCWQDLIDKQHAALAYEVSEREKALSAAAAAAAAKAAVAAAAAAAAPSPAEAAPSDADSVASSRSLSTATSSNLRKMTFLEGQLKAEIRAREDLEALLGRIQNPSL